MKFLLLRLATTLVALTFASVVGAATIAVTDAPPDWRSIDTNPADFARLGACGSSVGGACAPVDTDGIRWPAKFNQDMAGAVNSRGTNRMRWTVKSDVAISGLAFTVKDWHDLPRSHGRITVGGSSITAAREPSGGLRHYIVRFTRPVYKATIRFATRLGDGVSVGSAKVCR